MGLLKVGKPLTWEEGLRHVNYVRQHGVLQFINNYNRLIDICDERLLYGDEIEYPLMKLDREAKRVRISLRSEEVREALRQKELDMHVTHGTAWHQEYGRWMVESTPCTPYSGYTTSLLQVERNMRLRRARLLHALGDEEIAPTVVAFPMMGIEDFTHPPTAPGGPLTESDFVSDDIINPHPRFGTLTANIRKRRESKVDIRVPLFEDVRTPEFQAGEGDPNIHMDAMAFGMGCCCLQLTFQASDVMESRYLYDQLAPLGPIMLALTAATPILKGRLAGTDVRWKVISASVDDRTPTERGESKTVDADARLAGGGVRSLSKSRYDAVSSYIHPSSSTFNDKPLEVDDELHAVLLDSGIDEVLSQHVAHLFTRDPLVIFEGSVEEVDDMESTEHFESLQSTNWQTLRWKPPPINEEGPKIGWRVEFRSMEVQLTDFENAAFTAFIVLVTRAVLVFDLDLRMPISKVDENMCRAHCQAATSKNKFWFRSSIIPGEDTVECAQCKEMTIDEIMNGSDSCNFVGFIPLCYAYLDHIQCDPNSFKRIDEFLSLVSKRASGELVTTATWMRKFVSEHPVYRQDSVVSQEVAYDLMVLCDEIGRGVHTCPELLGNIVIEPVVKEGAYKTALDKSKLTQDERSHLLQNIRGRATGVDGPGSSPTTMTMQTEARRKSLS
uniref:Glutamate--cysteine ligase n=1 Tax=Noctiluca scintillans TaxID=2966 RepID=A0A7S1AJ05_NOCSC